MFEQRQEVRARPSADWLEIRQVANPHVGAPLVEAMTFHPHADFVAPLVELLKKCPPDDTHLKYAARVALRNCLRDDEKSGPARA